jgi:hypothetical protein
MTEVKSPQLVRPGPIGLGIRVILGATVLYWFGRAPHQVERVRGARSHRVGRLYTLFTIWLLPKVFASPSDGRGALAGRSVRGRRPMLANRQSPSTAGRHRTLPSLMTYAPPAGRSPKPLPRLPGRARRGRPQHLRAATVAAATTVTPSFS